MINSAPELFHLHRISWQMFGTLTFSSGRDIPGADVQVKMFFSLVRDICRFTKTHFNTALWVLRREAGELGGRLHLHYLMGGFADGVVTRSLCFASMAAWESHGGGHARVRQYNTKCNGVGYVLKALGSQAADFYEFEKFGSAAHLMLSYSVQRALVGYLRGIERRTDAALADSSIASGSNRVRVGQPGIAAHVDERKG